MVSPPKMGCLLSVKHQLVVWRSSLEATHKCGFLIDIAYCLFYHQQRMLPECYLCCLSVKIFEDKCLNF